MEFIFCRLYYLVVWLQRSSLYSRTIFWLPVLSLYFSFFPLRQKESVNHTPIADGKAAMITTKIPSEPFDIVRNTLECMLNQDFPRKYDVWLADEDPSEETIIWCREHGVKISCRRDDPNYHREIHPRKAKCKEGNLSFFYDHWGYKYYDFVIQFDADHAPEPQFLKEVMKEFSDDAVGYVATPSITDGNMDDSWTVRARAFWESTNHGPIQSGSNSGFSPMCYGSHYSLRTKALKEIGGIGPEFAEDHTTTLLMNAHGWKGAFARNAIAHGNGAIGIGDSLMQEYQWALIGVRALFHITPKYFFKLRPGVAFQFIIWELWYPVVSIVTLISVFLPLYALSNKEAIVGVEADGFIFRYVLLNAMFLLYVVWLRYKQQLRPTWAWQVSWETIIFQLIQFPWIAIGCLVGVYEVLTGRRAGKFGITSKDANQTRNIPLFMYFPHLIIVFANLAVIFLIDDAGPARGYFWFCWFICFSYGYSIFIGLLLSIEENFKLLDLGGKLTYLWNHKYVIVFTIVAIVLTNDALFLLLHKAR
jgi:cellulose synthase (UDP-forming)